MDIKLITQQSDPVTPPPVGRINAVKRRLQQQDNNQSNQSQDQDLITQRKQVGY